MWSVVDMANMAVITLSQQPVSTTCSYSFYFVIPRPCVYVLGTLCGMAVLLILVHQ